MTHIRGELKRRAPKEVKPTIWPTSFVTIDAYPKKYAIKPVKSRPVVI